MSPVMVGLMAVMGVDAVILGRKVGKMVDAKFPTNTESHWKLGMYAAGRASQMRRMRAPRPQVERGGSVRLRIARKPSDPGAHPGARRDQVGQIPVGGGSNRYVTGTRSAGAIPGPGAGRPRRCGLGAPDRRTPRSPARALVHGRNRGNRNTIAGVAYPDARRRSRCLADRHAGPPPRLGRRIGAGRRPRRDRRHARRGRRFCIDAGAGQPGGRVDRGAGYRRPAAGSPTNWAPLTRSWRRCAIG